MRLPAVLLAILLLNTGRACGEEKAPNWVKVTDHAGWQPRDSSGETVFHDRRYPSHLLLPVIPL